MKKLFQIRFWMILSIMSLSTILSYADTENGVVVMTMFHQSIQDNPREPEYEDEGNRKPSRPFTVYIDSTNGITVPGYNTEEILSYEVYTVDGDLVASFIDQEDFITFIFSSEGTYEIRFQFEEITLAGFINL